MTEQTGLGFDQVLLVPSESNVLPNAVRLQTTLTDKLTLNIPLLLDPKVTTIDLAETMAELGGVAILPPTTSLGALEMYKNKVGQSDQAALDSDGHLLVGVEILNCPEGAEYIDAGADFLYVTLPTELTTTELVLITELKQRYADTPLMVGRIQTPEEAEKVIAAGADVVVVGNRQAQPVFAYVTDTMTIAEIAGSHNVPVITAGGINYSGDVVKAIASGAHGVMLDKLNPDVELSDEIFQILGGLKSGMGYTGADSIPNLMLNAQFTQITDAGLTESHPHDVQITKDAPNYQSHQ
jgi:IMP dehydrogenase/GMP reductase